MRHLKNLNELVLYAAISCGAAFIGRLFPALHFPILLLRFGLFLYCAYVIAMLEQNRETALILGSAIFIGLIGGYWDLIEVWLRYDFNSIAQLITITLLFIAALLGIYVWSKGNGKASQK